MTKIESIARKYDLDTSALNPAQRAQIEGDPDLFEWVALMTALEESAPTIADVFRRVGQVAAGITKPTEAERETLLVDVRRLAPGLEDLLVSEAA